MEVCKIVEGQRYSKKLIERQITALLKVACQRVHEREKDIMQTVFHNAYHEEPYAKEFGINISDKLAQVEARILPAPWIFTILVEYLSQHATRSKYNRLMQLFFFFFVGSAFPLGSCKNGNFL
ncbi:hypothetical protein MKW94_019854 [Papaver nudicaule]|uniref:Argonaute linker 2 domain-containing protein n=1 Tax=Papaver nudicaule TaxID=74823 RepID=A0AA41S287_PAPNU|nr:hypothetical protein [Papaver nudicaule]